jgi:hypothetical protein
MAVDLTKGFYFSLSYHLAATLQANYRAGVLAGGAVCPPTPNTDAGCLQRQLGRHAELMCLGFPSTCV